MPNPSRETKFSGANGDREIFIFHVQLTSSRMGNITLLILTLNIADDHTYTTKRLDSVITIVTSVLLVI